MKKIIEKVILVFAILSCVLFLLYLEKGTVKKETSNTIEWEPFVKENLKEEAYIAVENNRFQLYFVESTMEVIVKDKENQMVYRSNPENAQDDSIAFGLNKTNVLSQLIVEYVDSQSNFYTSNSWLLSVRDGNVDFVIDEKGILVTYYFSDAGFEVPVYYGIEEEYFTAKILCEKIITHGKYTLTALSLLPFMGSGGLEDEGYLFVPDGSGSIITFNNNKQSYLSYSQPVYGVDAALNIQSNIEVKKDIMMPVFGIKKNNHAMLAVISEGEYQAEINAEVSRKNTSNNTVYSTIRFVKVETNVLFPGSGNEEKTEMLSEQFIDFPAYEVRYYFLSEGSGYTEMALKYQEYLIKEKGMRKSTDEVFDKAKVNVTFIGGVEFQKTLLGVPYKNVEALTSYEAVLRLSKELLQEGTIDLNVKYIGFLKGGYQNSKLPKSITYESNLGGKKAFQNLVLEMKANGVDFYPSFDPVRMYRTGNGFRSTDSARYVSRTAANQYSYYLTSGMKIENTAYRILAPDKVAEVIKGLKKEINKKNISSISLEGITNVLYSDFRANGIGRNEAGIYFSTLIKDIAEVTDKLMLEKAYAYGIPYTDAIVGVPLAGSEYDVTDYSVPFYQIALSGYVWMYSEPINMQGNIKDYLLKMIEFGTNPSYLLMESNQSVVMNTNYTKFYANNYYDWKEELISTAKYLNPLHVVYGERIVAHEKSEGVSKTVYENGAIVYVNYNKEDVEVEGVTIKRKDYVIIDREEAK